MTPQVEAALKKLINYSLKDIEYKYSNLTDTEKSLITKAEFTEIIDWLYLK